mgnify:CR=1 FL=1
MDTPPIHRRFLLCPTARELPEGRHEISTGARLSRARRAGAPGKTLDNAPAHNPMLVLANDERIPPSFDNSPTAASSTPIGYATAALAW